MGATAPPTSSIQPATASSYGTSSTTATVARNRVHIHASPEDVFAVLADPCRYPEWVVGASSIREYDEGFPAVGSRFHHEVGPGPLNLKDYSEVTEVDPPRRLVLKAKARPLGTATIELDLRER